jgi:hypothetical protein
MNVRRIATSTAAVLTLLWGSTGQASTNPIISVGPYTPSTVMPFVVPIDITGAIDEIFWQFDVAYDATDVQINTSCDPFSDSFCDFVTGPITEGPFFGSLSPFNVFNPGFILLDSVTLAQLGQLIAVNDTFGGSLPGPSGNGVLAYIEFVTTATGSGTSPITVQNGSAPNGVPEPPTLALLVGGLALLGARRWVNSRTGDAC